MSELLQFYRKIDDPRGYFDEYPDPRMWRIHLREKVYKVRKGRSDLTQMPLIHSFDLHEGIFSRRWVGYQNWQQLLFAGPNVFTIRMEEHIPEPPDRTICYWLSVVLYDKLVVDKWINSLPFKTRPSTPWVGTYGIKVISEVPERYIVHSSWHTWLERNKKILDIEA